LYQSATELVQTFDFRHSIEHIFCFPNIVRALAVGTFCIVSDTLVDINVSFIVAEEAFYVVSLS